MSMFRRGERSPLYHGGGPPVEVDVLRPGLLVQVRVGCTSIPVPSINTLDLHSLRVFRTIPRDTETAEIGEASNVAM